MGIQFEEHDLVKAHGREYAEYRKQVPMFIPRLMGKDSVDGKAAANSAVG